ncbi:hypothetical protein NW765_017593 [Fusarium oxysporum]|nr:hypothetical protein NW765_017593 [Fusarium oxysporum]KAJ4263748.1 hypothetical protein NW764_016044 [Fusarium oxysporum]
MAFVPRTMRAATVVRRAGSSAFEITNQPVPTPGPTDILLRLAVTGVCGTDMSMAAGKMGPTKNILGHEGVGYVVQLGEGVPKGQVKLGDRVGVAWLRDVCRICAYCLHPGGETRCQEQLNSGREIDGTFAQYALVPYRYLLLLPKSISAPDEMVAPVLCGGVTAYTALKHARIVPGQWVAISGAGGGVGSLGVQYAKAMGYRVIAIDVGDLKREFCLQSGAEHFIDATITPDLRGEVMAITDSLGVSSCIVSATSATAYTAALDILAPFGSLVCIGIPPLDQVVSFHPLLLIDRGIKIVGSSVGTHQEMLEAIRFVERGLVKPVINLRLLDDLPGIGSEFLQAVGKFVIRFEDDGFSANGRSTGNL